MAKKKQTMKEQPLPTSFNTALPESLHIPPDPLRLRLDFHSEIVTMTKFETDAASTKVVSVFDVAQALANELSFSTGLLPEGILWWSNTRNGVVMAFYMKPGIRKLALQTYAGKPPERYEVPMPGLIFLCRPASPPWVFAVKKRPETGDEDQDVYNAPLCNIFTNGKSCPGNHKYPQNVKDIPESFMTSFFSATADLQKRSKKYPTDVVKLWKYLKGKKAFPMNDLVKFGTVQDLMQIGGEI
jgi:PRTRC genetic system protein B